MAFSAATLNRFHTEVPESGKMKEGKELIRDVHRVDSTMRGVEQAPACRIERLVLHSIEGFELIRVNEILYVECQGESRRVKHLRLGYLFVKESMEEISRQLSSFPFLKIRKGMLLNLNLAQRLLAGPKPEIVMENGEHIALPITLKNQVIQKVLLNQ